MTNDGESSREAAFPQTHWSIVLSAGENSSAESFAALESLCRAYWFPLYAYVRRCGESADNAKDLTQGFFARLLEKNWLRAASRERGRFRWFLLASLKHFLANEWDRARTQKRGGGRQPVSLDEIDLEARYLTSPADNVSADKAYDRTWALTLLEKTRARLREEFREAGKAERFEALEQFLPGETAAATYAEIGMRLGMTEGTVKSDVSRLRRRYGEVLREELVQTLGSMTDLEDELQHLFEALS
ncbi:MAG: sigma-70 family RNA polymerase sigma factor [Verrucomicrobiota bacterium]